MLRSDPVHYEAMKPNGDRVDVVTIPDTEIQKYNNDGWDIYWTWNYCSPKRGIANLKKIYSFYVDIDLDPKMDRKTGKRKILDLIRKSPLVPSTLIETYNGYQIYWDLDKPIEVTDPVGQAKWFKEFTNNRLVPFFKGDSNASDATRLLRAPFTRYWGLKPSKAPPQDEVFHVALHWGNETEYSLEAIEAAFPEKVVKVTPKPFVTTKAVVGHSGANGVGLVDSLPSIEWLRLFSGHEAFKHEVVTFRQEGPLIRIFFNGHRSNSWIDQYGKIGSKVGAGPTILKMLEWYGNPTDKAYELLKEMKRGKPQTQ